MERNHREDGNIPAMSVVNLQELSRPRKLPNKSHSQEKNNKKQTIKTDTNLIHRQNKKQIKRDLIQLTLYLDTNFQKGRSSNKQKQNEMLH